MIIKLIIVTGILITGALAIKEKNMTYRQSILKKSYALIMKAHYKKGKQNIQLNKTNVSPNESIYDIVLTTLDGKALNMSSLKGRKILIVNTASDCGYTGQYESLQKLYEENIDRLIIIGVPSNDFKEQESASNEKISVFCKINYGVTFPLVSKSIVIKSENQNELYKWLSDSRKNGWCDIAPEWNFCKYFIDEEGKLIGYFPMSIDPLSEEIKEHLA